MTLTDDTPWTASAVDRMLADAARLVDVLGGAAVVRTEIYLRSAAASGALVSCRHCGPKALAAALSALGTSRQSVLLGVLARGVPARDRAVKLDLAGALSLFQAIDIPAPCLRALCAPFGLGTEAAQLARFLDAIRLAVCGWALDVDRPARALRLRFYAMADADRSTLPSSLAELVRQPGAGEQLTDAWHRWAVAGPVVLNFQLAPARPAAVKIEFADVELDAIGAGVTGGPPARWADWVRTAATAVGVLRASHLGIRWRSGEPPQWCAYLLVAPQVLDAARRKP